MPHLQFWYDFASTYSYLSAMRIKALAEAAQVDIVWRPFLLGPIFKAQGWENSPFNLYPARGRYMVRDLERIAKQRYLQFALPDPFPMASVLPARLALMGENEGWVSAFTTAVFQAEFAGGKDISSPETIGAILTHLGLDAAALIAKTQDDDIKNALKKRVSDAQCLGIFGAPSFMTDSGELFWGDDRLEAALAWAKAATHH